MFLSIWIETKALVSKLMFEFKPLSYCINQLLSITYKINTSQS